MRSWRSLVLLAVFVAPGAAMAACPSETTDNGFGTCTSLNGVFSSPRGLSAPSLLFVLNGHVTGTGALSVSGTANGGLTIDPGGSFTVSAGTFGFYSSATTNNGTVTNAGEMVAFEPNTGSVNFVNNATFNNSGSFRSGWGQGNSGRNSPFAITNTGTINNTGTFRNGGLVINSGTFFNASGGALLLADRLTVSGQPNGAPNFDNSGAIVNNGTISLTGGSSIYGAGSIANNGTINISSGHNDTWLMQATAVFGYSANLSGGTLSGGTWNVTSPQFVIPNTPLVSYELASLAIGTDAITALSASTTVSLTGQNARFEQLNSLSSNGGTVNLVNRVWTFASGFTNDGTLNASLGGPTSGPRGLTWGSASRLRVTDSLTNTGTMTINGAAIVSAQPTSAITISNSGTLMLAGSRVEASLLTNSGTLTNQGSVIAAQINNSGVINNSGELNTRIANTGSGSILNSGSLDLSSATNDGRITNGGNVTVRAGGALTGTGSYKQTAGVTTINGTVSQNVEISGGVLKGSGTINGDLVATGGFIAAGNSPGTLTIDGDADFSGATLDLEIGGTGDGLHDLLNITGVATLAGTTVIFDFVNGYAPKAGDAFSLFMFLSAAGGVTGVDDTQFAVTGLESGFEYSFDANGTLVALSDGSPSDAAPVPLPAAAYLLLSAFGGLNLLRRSSKAGQAAR